MSSRFLIVAPIALVVTVALFFLMRDLITSSHKQPEVTKAPSFEIGREVKEQPTPERPLNKPTDEKPPKPEKLDFDTARRDTPTKGVPMGDPPKLDHPDGVGPGFVDGPATPIVRSKPPYPSCGTGTGEVVLDYMVEPDGSVADVRVVSATSSCFANAAKRATSHWRYRPKVEEGKPVRSERLRVTLVFQPE